MNTQSSTETLIAAVLVLAIVACGPQGDADGAAANPPPYAGAAELELGESHEFSGGHSVTVHAVEHRFKGTFSDKEMLLLAAEVEFCAGATPLVPPSQYLLLFQESPFDMQGTMMVMHSSGPPASLGGLKQPALDDATEVQPGECVRGWVEYLNVYDEHGKPTKLGFGEDSASTAVIWPVAE